MKKILLFLFAVLLCFPALSGCGDEEKVIEVYYYYMTVHIE